MSTTNSSFITKEFLRNYHTQHIQTGHTNEHNTISLVNVLGGIDSILTDYLCNKELTLNEFQLQH